jgi:regulator of protease activity HflC (stomatin/prohibitin superfamily)
MADDEKPTADGTDDIDPLGAPATVPAEKKSRRERADDGGRAGVRRSSGRRSRLFLVGVVVVVIALLAFTPMIAGAFEKTPRDKIGISYGGGPFEGSHFQKVVRPGSGLFFNGFFDSLYLYPADQLNYIITKTAKEGSTSGHDSVVAPSNDRVQVEYQVAVYFKLNTDRLREFHEELGLKYEAYRADGWDRLVQDTFRQQIENAIQAETRRYPVADLYSDPQLLADLQLEVQQSLGDRLERALGGQYFCGPTFRPGGRCAEPAFVIKRVDIPERVKTAFENNRTSEVEIQTKQNEVQQRTAEAEGIAALNQALAAAGDDYVLLRAIESGKIDFWVVPDSSGLTLQAPPAPGAP